MTTNHVSSPYVDHNFPHKKNKLKADEGFELWGTISIDVSDFHFLIYIL